MLLLLSLVLRLPLFAAPLPLCFTAHSTRCPVLLPAAPLELPIHPTL